MSKDLNDRLKNQDLAFIEKFSLHPADAAEGSGSLGEAPENGLTQLDTTLVRQPGKYKSGFAGSVQKKLATVLPVFKPKDDFVRVHTIEFRVMKKLIAYVNLTRESSSTTMKEGINTISMAASYDSAKSQSDWIPVYFLPWADNFVISLTIPKKAPTTGPDPSVFLTAAINGCSVFVQGTPDQPTIYHAGGETKRGKDHFRAAGFWREVVMNFADTSKGKFQSEISKVDYIKTPGFNDTTPNAAAYENWLKSKYSKMLQIQQVNPWGCVFGFRDKDRNWKFYLQENCTVLYTFLTAKNGAPDVKMQRVSRPIVLREIFPAQPAGVPLNNTIPPITVSAL